MHQIADAADIEDDVILARPNPRMPVSLPIMTRAIMPRARAGEMGMGDGRGQRIGGIGLFAARRRQEHADHGLHLFLAGMADADHAFLDVVGRVFGDFEIGLRRGQKGDGAGMADLERGRRILGDKGLLDRDGHGPRCRR